MHRCQAVFAAATDTIGWCLRNVMMPMPRIVQPRIERQEPVRWLAATFPGRSIEFVDALSAHWVGGGLHCATLNRPA
jgi:agmatine/peptidylarginine deiminase